MPRRITKADRIRALHAKHPELSQSELARHERTSRSAVHDALRKHAPWGRAPLEYTTITLRVRRDLLRYARELAKGKGGSAVADVLVAALEASLVPESERRRSETTRSPSKQLGAKRKVSNPRARRIKERTKA